MVSLGSLFSSHLVIFPFGKQNLHILSIMATKPVFCEEVLEILHTWSRTGHIFFNNLLNQFICCTDRNIQSPEAGIFNFPTQIEVMMISALCTETKGEKT